MRERKIVRTTLITALFLALTGARLGLPACGQTTDAGLIKEVEEAIQNHQLTEKTRENIEQLLEKEPANYHVHYLAGLYFDQLALPQQSLEQFELATKYGPNDPKSVEQLIAHQFRLGNKDAAATLIMAACQRFPDNAELLYLAGANLLHYKKYSKAQALLLQAMRLKPGIPGLAAALGELEYTYGNYSKALKYANWELLRYPNSIEGSMLKGMVLAKYVHYTQAEPLLGRAFTLLQQRVDDYPDMLEALAKASCWLEHYEQALNPILAHIAVTTKPYDEDTAMKQRLIYCLKRVPKAKSREIVADISQNLVVAKNNPDYQNLVGVVLDTVGMQAEAIPRFRAAIALRPDFGEALFNLAKDVETYSHNYDEAVSLYQKARLLGYNNATMYLDRLEDRLLCRQRDLAWQLRNWLHRAVITPGG